MIVTFTSKAGPNVVMFGNVALALLRLMGCSGTIPSALRPEDIPAALTKLEEGLARQPAAVRPATEDGDAEPVVALATRAKPLQALLRAAHAAGCHIMWDRS